MIRRKKSDSQILFVISDWSSWKNNKHKIEVRISQLVEVVDVVHFISLLTLYLVFRIGLGYIRIYLGYEFFGFCEKELCADDQRHYLSTDIP